jgi:hypothetical protein
MAGAEQFYDALAPEYHVLFDDWWTAATAHGAFVARLRDTGYYQPVVVAVATGA